MSAGIGGARMGSPYVPDRAWKAQRMREEFRRRWSRLHPTERHELLSSEIREPLYRLTNNPAAFTLTDQELSEQLEPQTQDHWVTPAELVAEYIPILKFNELGLDALGQEDVEGWQDELDGVETVQRWLGLES